MNLRQATFAALVATSSAWLSPASTSTKRSIHHGPRRIHQQQQQQRQRSKGTIIGSSSLLRQFTNSMTTKTALQSAVAAPSSSSSDATAGRPIAMGSIVNVFRGGLVAVRVDDDLAKVALSLQVDLPEVVDPSQSVPDEMKSTKSKSNTLGTKAYYIYMY